MGRSNRRRLGVRLLPDPRTNQNSTGEDAACRIGRAPKHAKRTTSHWGGPPGHADPTLEGYSHVVYRDKNLASILSYRLVLFPPTNIQDIAMRIRSPAPIPNVPAAPILPTKALAMKPPTKSANAAKDLWSRDATLSRNLNNLGSDMSSTQIVVKTTKRIS